MKIESAGGAAEDGVEERLARRFAAELGRAENDYPELRLGARDAAENARIRRGWPRLVALPLGIVAVVLVALVGAPLLMPGAAPVAPAFEASGVTFGSNGMPIQFDGERVYRAADQSSFASIEGSFLLGGRVTKPEVMPPCPAPLGQSEAEQQLIPYCYWLSIDGLAVAPMSSFDEPNNEVVVARVHVNDPLAAQCPIDVRPQCETEIVVESVVWRSSEGAIASTPPVSPTPTPEVTNPVSTTGTGPLASETIGPPPSIVPPPSAGGIGSGSADGVPTAIDGKKVLRAADLTPSGSVVLGSPPFLLGGRLGRDTSCAVPSPANVVPPSCGYWTVDGVKVGTTIALSEAQIGELVVASVTVSKSLVDCTGAPCPPAAFYLVTEIVWTGQSSSALPTPPAPLTP